MKAIISGKQSPSIGLREDEATGKEWWEEECFRVSGEVDCEICGRPYWRHEQVAKKEAPTFVRACDGRLLKL